MPTHSYLENNRGMHRSLTETVIDEKCGRLETLGMVAAKDYHKNSIKNESHMAHAGSINTNKKSIQSDYITIHRQNATGIRVVDAQKCY